MLDITKVIKRNEKFWNKKWYINESLEIKLLREELRETTTALSELQLAKKYWPSNIQPAQKEIIDGCIDIMFVAIWTLHKLGLTVHQISQAFDIVCESNLSKLWAWKDENGKVKKWENFKEPDFTDIIETL